MTRFARNLCIACALIVTLALWPSSPAMADDPGPLWVAPDPKTLEPLPADTQQQQSVTAMKEKSAARVAEITALKEQHRISEEQWRARLLEIRKEVDAFKQAAGLPVPRTTTNKLTSESLVVTTTSLDWLQGMQYVDQTVNCQNGCGVANSKAVLDYEHNAYGTPSYTFDQVRQDLALTCCAYSGCPGVCISNYTRSIENTLERLGTSFNWVAIEPGSYSTWYNRIVTSVSSWRYPQVQIVRPNYGGVTLDGWAGADANSHHYITVSGYNSTDGNVWYQESAWWTPGDKWWYANQVYSANNNADANTGCAAPNKLIW